MSNSKYIINKTAIAASFSAAAHTYDHSAFVEQEIGRRLLQRLEDIKTQPKYILDLGCGTGYFGTRLQQLYPAATIIGLDLAFGMANFASINNNLNSCCADAEQLPFAAQQFDLIFANCCLQSISDLHNLFVELQRVLTIDGMLLFSTFGPDTLQEFGFENQYQDMHIIGDLLTALQFKNPVLDMEYLNFTYEKLQVFLEDLQQSGGFNIDLNGVPNLNLPCGAKFEIIYGQTWKQKQVKQYKDQQGNTLVPLSEITILS